MRLLRRVRLRRPWRAKDPLHRRKPAVAPSPGGDLPSPVAASRGQINHPRFFRHDPRGCSSHGSAPIVRRKTSFFSVLGDWQQDEQRVEVIRPAFNGAGKWTYETNSYVQLASGLNYWSEETRSWEPSIEEIVIAQRGAVALRGQQKV